MSIDLQWDGLDAALSSSLVELLNKQLANTPRPSFIGPVEVSAFEFGTACPDIELVDLRDIYRDFLEDDDDELEDGDSKEAIKVTEGGSYDDDEGFEWVSRKALRKNLAEEAPAYHHLPPHIRYGRTQSMEMFSSTPSLMHPPRDMWSGGSMSFPGLVDLRPGFAARSSPASMYRSPLSADPPTTTGGSRAGWPGIDPSISPSPLQPESDDPSQLSPPSQDQSPPPNPNPLPNIQLHFHISWRSNLRLSITTSLLINYPSPMFMSLPIKLSVTGLLFNGELAVAYEGARRRVHLCILDDLDPYGPAGDRSHKRDSINSTPPEPEDDSPGAINSPPRLNKPLPIGQRLLPSIYIESEIGQADKHVLKNVTRVERFIQDVIRKTVEEELVFPNFHTLIMGDQ
ncbi:hypothetical protein JAAARDRAFT_32191 [Jaapia argillacea MUCL 33604]|uniref:Mitochondrial distribution and morphology protein 12 n=1 Tax=Jaapia argillacea MUCL 33604 TaxID=933084 RepID=A0A067Q2I5_9AGAM|nr:hypothetical protein JAAARDRAFT_32191 [Jaapia argillacea MUCL 33604]